jgi:hypothetical protein
LWSVSEAVTLVILEKERQQLLIKRINLCGKGMKLQGKQVDFTYVKKGMMFDSNKKHRLVFDSTIDAENF